MNLVEPGITVNNWTVEFRHPEPPQSDSEIQPLSAWEQLRTELLSVQPMTGECGNLFNLRCEPTMMVELPKPFVIRTVTIGMITIDATGGIQPFRSNSLAESEIPPLIELP